MPIGKGRGCSARSGRMPSPSPSSCRRRTSPARCTSAMRSTIRCRTSSSATRGCRARTACGWSAWTMPASPRRWWSSATSSTPGDQARRHRPRSIHRACLGVEGAVGRPDHPPAPPPRRQLRLGQRALHHGRGLFGRGHQGVRRALQARPALSRQAAGQLGPQVPDRDQRPGGRDPRGAGPVLAPQISAGRRIGRDPCRHHPAGNDAGRHGGRGSPRRRALRGAGRQADQASDHRTPDPDHHRRACRSRAWLRRGQDHAGP